MRKVELNMNEQLKYDVIKLVVQGKKTKTRAAITLGITVRSVNRLIVKYKTGGKESFIHGNRSKTKVELKFSKIKDEIITLYEIKYEGFNYAHFHEQLIENEGYTVSESTVRKWLNSEGFISPKANRKTKREHKKLQLVKDNPNILNENIDLDEIAEIELCDAHPSRERKKYMGELIQLDASDHLWFGIKKTSLHAAIDDASGKIVGLYFDTQETLNGYYNVFKQILINYGIPYEFITDRRTVFEYKKKNASLDKDTFTQFSYACKTLGTHITTSSVPQAKGRIERLFNTLQSRLISELRLNNIETITEANKYLDLFKQKFNLKFALPIKDTKNVYESVKNQRQIDLTLAILSPRVINNGSCIKFNNKTYYPEYDNSRKYFDKRTKALVIKTLSGKLYVSIADRVYLMKELLESELESKSFDQIKTAKKSTKKYIPPMNHPWRISNLKKFAKNQKHLNEENLSLMFD